MEQTALPDQNTGVFTKFSPFRRVEAAKSGGAAPTVWGIATLEQPDLDNEICHYDTAKAAYEKWSSAMAKRTAKAGQTISLGNIRLQHGTEVGGKATKVEFNDEAREIWLGSEPIDKEVHNQLKDGFYTGYSQGGSYAWRKCAECEGDMPMKQRANFCDSCNKDVQVLYGLAGISEVSYVDYPCSDEGFEYVKANGSRELVKFKRKEPLSMDKTHKDKTKRVAGEDLTHDCFAYVGDTNDPSTWKLPIKFKSESKTKSHLRNALARFDQTKGIPDSDKAKVQARILSMAHAHGIDTNEKAVASYRELPEFITKAVDTAAEAKGFRKGLYAVGNFADVLNTLAYLYRDSVYERDSEGDDSTVPEQLAENLDQLIETFLAMAEEEARELAAQSASNKTNTGEMTVTPEELQKQQDAEKAAKKSIASSFAKTACNHDKLNAAHTSMASQYAAKAVAAKALLESEYMKAEDAPAALKAYVEANVAAYTELAKSSTLCAKASAAVAELNHAAAKAADEVEHSGIVKQFEDAAKTESTPATAPAAKAVPSIDADVAAEAERQRNSPEYKDAVSKLAKSMLEKELEKLREKTIVPDGALVAGEVSKGANTRVVGGLTSVGRDNAEEFSFAAPTGGSTTAGL